ncbi:MAG: hypothetical protein GX238_01305 [Epulopiscium sp.]|nr:hypothetical protein [Candidatus Epulonipiscium sp.]
MKKKIMYSMFIVSLLTVILICKKWISYKHMEFFVKNQKYDVYYRATQIHIHNQKGIFRLLPEENKVFIDVAIGDINADGDANLLVLQGEKRPYGEELVVYDLQWNSDGLQVEERYRNHIAAVKPWKIEICDIDGDNELEIFIAVNKATRYYTKIENRPFFFNFKNDILVKKWTGSKVRAPFIDAYFIDLNKNGRDEFVVIEEAQEGGFVVALYYWFGFGFVLQAESPSYDKIHLLRSRQIGEDIFLEVRIENNNRTRRIFLEPSSEKTKNGVYLLRERRK